jgi:hypothetical protein
LAGDLPVTWSSNIADYLAELQRLGPEVFLVTYPHPVLVHRFAPRAAAPPPVDRFRTDLLSRPTRMAVVDGGPGDLEVSVHAIKKRPGNLYDDAVMLGRAPSNDIVLPYTDLSKLHAYFGRAPDGGWFVADAGSTNGTWLDEAQLAANQPAPLGERTELAFGESPFEAFTARAFAGWLRARR